MLDHSCFVSLASFFLPQYQGDEHQATPACHSKVGLQPEQLFASIRDGSGHAEAPGLVPVLCLVVAAWYYVWERIDSIHLVKREVSRTTRLSTVQSSALRINDANAVSVC